MYQQFLNTLKQKLKNTAIVPAKHTTVYVTQHNAQAFNIAQQYLITTFTTKNVDASLIYAIKHLHQKLIFDQSTTLSINKYDKFAQIKKEMRFILKEISEEMEQFKLLEDIAMSVFKHQTQKQNSQFFANYQ